MIGLSMCCVLNSVWQVIFFDEAHKLYVLYFDHLMIISHLSGLR